MSPKRLVATELKDCMMSAACAPFAPCPLPQMDAALTENADVVAVSASRGTNTGELWGLIERHLQSVELAQRKLGE